MTNPGLKSVPIKPVTSYAFAGADKALAAGYKGHVSRPYRPHDPLGKFFPIWRKSSKVAFSHVAAQSHCTGMSQLALKSLLGAARQVNSQYRDINNLLRARREV
jgi:hypothetical protein